MRLPELDYILAAIADPAERESAAAAFGRLAQGDPKSFPVSFAIASLAVSRAIRDTVAATRNVKDQAAVWATIREAADETRQAAAWFRRLSLGWIASVAVLALAVAFGAGYYEGRPHQPSEENLWVCNGFSFASRTDLDGRSFQLELPTRAKIIPTQNPQLFEFQVYTTP